MTSLLASTPAAASAVRSADGYRPLKQMIRLLFRKRSALFSVLLVCTVALLAIAAPILPLADPSRQDLVGRLMPPVWSADGSWDHLLGTDHLGRDILSRIVWGARVSLIVGLSAVAIAGTLGVTAGIVAGYFGGLLDTILMRLADAQLAIPFILLVIAVVSVVGSGIEKVVVILGVTGWVIYARVARAEVLSIREREYVQAARALGATNPRILRRHIFPNILGSVAVIASIEVANVILIESTLGFLGLGVQPPTPSWGNMLGEGRDYLLTASWLATLPGLALAITSLSINILGDFLRDVFDPRTLEQQGA